MNGQRAAVAKVLLAKSGLAVTSRRNAVMVDCGANIVDVVVALAVDVVSSYHCARSQEWKVRASAVCHWCVDKPC